MTMACLVTHMADVRSVFVDFSVLVLKGLSKDH